MADNSMPPPPGAASPPTAVMRPGPGPGRALLAVVLILAGSAVIGIAGGLLWAAVAPRVQYQMYSLKPEPTAYATNPETSAFIAADGWYCFIALAGGALIGLLAYLFAVRRYGALAMAGAVGGSIGAAFIAQWLGHQASGGPGFNELLARSKPGTYLYAPIALGSHGALAFWPLAAAAVAGGIELIVVMRDRHPVQASGVAMPGMDSFSVQPYPVPRPDSGQSGQPGATDRAWRPDTGLSGSRPPSSG
jgi:hypothetical protein